MAATIEQLRALFDKMSVTQKKAYIDKMKAQLNGASSLFLNECVQKYNNELRGDSKSPAMESSNSIPTATKTKNPLTGVVVTLSVLLVASVIGGGAFLMSTMNASNSESRSSSSKSITSSMDGNSTNAGNISAQESKLVESSKSRIIEFIPEDYETIPYAELDTHPNNYVGRKLKYRGEIVQYSGGGNWRVEDMVSGDVLYVREINDESLIDNLIEGDIVEVYGIAQGEYTYTSTANHEITIPLIDGVRLEKINPLELIEYPKEPFVAITWSYSGEIRRQATIESFEITGIEYGYSDNMKAMYRIIGTMDIGDDLSIDVNCYDDEDFLLETVSIYDSVAQGERFKVEDSIYILSKTVRIEFVDKW